MAHNNCFFRLTFIALNLFVFSAIILIIIQFSLYFVSNELKQSICHTFCSQLLSDCLFTACKSTKCIRLTLIDIIVFFSLNLKLYSQLFTITALLSNDWICWQLYLTTLVFNIPWIAFAIYDSGQTTDDHRRPTSQVFSHLKSTSFDSVIPCIRLQYS